MRHVIRVLVVLGILLIGAAVMYWQLAPRHQSQQAALQAQRDSLQEALVVLEEQSTWLQQLADSLQARYGRDTVRLVRVEHRVDSIPGWLDQYADSVGVPKDTVRAWVETMLDLRRSCRAALTSCEERVAAAESQRDNATLQRDNALAQSRNADQQVRDADARLQEAQAEARKERVAKWAALTLAALAAVFR